MLNKLCRICPNTAKWRYPTKKIGENKSAFTDKYGFGFEEWLNREDWLLSGYQGVEREWNYAYIHGLFTESRKYDEQLVNILFYVKKKGQKSQAVAHLDKAYVLGVEEADWANQQFFEQGWFHLMHGEVKSIGGDIKGLPAISTSDEEKDKWATLFAPNIRFRPGSLDIFGEPKLLVSEPRSFYYGNVLDWDGILPTESYIIPAVKITPQLGNTRITEKYLDRFSVAIQNRRASAGKDVIPRQAPIQNALSVQLSNHFSPLGGIVTCEDERVDIKLVAPDKSVTFIEIKPAASARQSIRQALGQLLEYAHYPSLNKADRFVVVSDAEAIPSDKEYLASLQKRYKISISYVYWPHGAKELSIEKLADFI